MLGSVQGPSYLSSHSADVILSDIRPIKLNEEALTCINLLLDEFLCNVLKAAQSLTTDKLRKGLLAVLPTTLGKEALLEAEVELRAYWDRAKGRRTTEDDKDSFDLTWAFELLRLKCQAYSTLNESDEDPVAERVLEERMTNGHPHPPSPTLISPASLYLTTILESMCEHILSNVGRVASRDSSRTYANVHDLFIALCEDDAIYGLFKTMNVYSRIEALSRTPRARRSKSLSKSDKLSRSASRISSPYQDKENGQEIATIVSPSSGSRTSLEKARSMKRFMPSRMSTDASQTSLHRSDSVLSQGSQQTFQEDMIADDNASLEEFDDLMRSTPTVKMSLTPDRLRTMEVHKQEQERDRRTSTQPDSEPIFSRTNGHSLRHVDSILEDEEPLSKSTSTPTKPSRTRSIVSPDKPSDLGRPRSRSSAQPPNSPRLLRKPSKPSIPLSIPQMELPTPPVPMSQSRRAVPQTFDASPFPQRTRRKQGNRESLDLDAVMDGSDDELSGNEVQSSKQIPLPPKRTAKVSATTKQLMALLDEGPPSTGSPGRRPIPAQTSPATPKMSRAGRELLEFLNEGPPDYMTRSPSTISFADNEKPKAGAGRLQRMISKLSIGTERLRANQGQDDISRTVRRQPSHPQSILHTKASNASMTPLPIYTPPRPPLISPPASPEDDVDYIRSSTRIRQASRATVPKREQSSSDLSQAHASPVAKATALENGMSSPSKARPHVASIQTVVEGNLPNGVSTKASVHVAGPQNGAVFPPTRKAPQPIATTVGPARVPAQPPTPAPTSPLPATPIKTQTQTQPQVQCPISEANDLRDLMAKATSAEECRIILDMFFTKAGVKAQPKSMDIEVPYASPSPSDTSHDGLASDTALEQRLVEFLLGSEVAPDGPRLRKKKHSSRWLKGVPDLTAAPPTVEHFNKQQALVG